MASPEDGSEQPDFPEWNGFLGRLRGGPDDGFIKKVAKRSGEVVDYDRARIAGAIGRAIAAVEGYANPDKAEMLTDAVEARLRLLLAGRHERSVPDVEEIQDTVEAVLIEGREVRLAKAYILYRERHAVLRAERLALRNVPVPPVPDGVASYELFVHEGSQECLAAQLYLRALPLAGGVVDVGTDAGLDEAALKGVLAAPTVIFYGGAGEVARARSVPEIRAFLAGGLR